MHQQGKVPSYDQCFPAAVIFAERVQAAKLNHYRRFRFAPYCPRFTVNQHLVTRTGNLRFCWPITSDWLVVREIPADCQRHAKDFPEADFPGTNPSVNLNESG